MKRILTGAAAMRREDRLQQREDRLTEKTSDLRAQIASLIAENERLREALKDFLQAVTGKTGFAASIREHSGTAYPWPALDLAEEKARAALQPKEGEG